MPHVSVCMCCKKPGNQYGQYLKRGKLWYRYTCKNRDCEFQYVNFEGKKDWAYPKWHAPAYREVNNG